LKAIKKYWVYPALACLLIVSTMARLEHFRTLYPYFIHYDEWRQADLSLKLIRNKTLNPNFFLYPHFAIYLPACAYTAYFAATNLKEIVATKSLEPVFSAAQKIDDKGWEALKVGRTLSLVFGLASILAFFFLARSLLGNGFGFLAAALFSLFPFSVSFSYLAKVDIFMIFFSIMSIWFQVELVKNGKTRDYVLAGIFAALAFNTKGNWMPSHSLLFAFLLRANAEKSISLKSLFDSRVFMSLAALALAFVVFNPYYLLHIKMGTGSLKYLLDASKIVPYYHIDPNAWWRDRYYYSLTVLIPSMVSLPVWILAIAGIIWQTLKTDFKEWAVPLFNLVFYLHFFDACVGSSFYHYYFYFLPLISLFCAYCLKMLYQTKRPGMGTIVAIMAFLLVLGCWCRRDVYYSLYFESYDQAGKWIAQHVKPGSKILSYSVYDPGPGLARYQTTKAWPQDLSEEAVKAANSDYILTDYWDFAGFDKFYKKTSPISSRLKTLTNGGWDYLPVQRFVAGYPGDWWYQWLDPEFIVELTLLERKPLK
jgi:hypothetical protein